jgi:hypothetical protein
LKIVVLWLKTIRTSIVYYWKIYRDLHGIEASQECMPHGQKLWPQTKTNMSRLVVINRACVDCTCCRVLNIILMIMRRGQGWHWGVFNTVIPQAKFVNNRSF